MRKLLWIFEEYIEILLQKLIEKLLRKISGVIHEWNAGETQKVKNIENFGIIPWNKCGWINVGSHVKVLERITGEKDVKSFMKNTELIS